VNLMKKALIIIISILAIGVIGIGIMKFTGMKFKFNFNNKKLDCKNNIASIDIGKIKTFELDDEQYIMVEISNNTSENKCDVSIEIQFINENNEVIFTTGTVKEVLVSKMRDNIYAKITSEISALVENNMVDIVINPL